MSDADLDDDDFVDLVRPDRPPPGIVMRCVAPGRGGRVRLSFSVTPELLAEIGGYRYRIGYSARKKMFRLAVDDQGPVEPTRIGKGTRVHLRCELPAGMTAITEDMEPEYYVDRDLRRILVEAPKEMLAPPSPPAAVPAPAAAKPAPAAAKSAPASKPDPVLAATLGLTETFPRRIDGVQLTSAEATILEVLYRHPIATRDALMMATADDAAEDERSDRVLDVQITRLRKKLEPLGIDILTERGLGWRLADGAKRFLARLVEGGAR